MNKKLIIGMLFAMLVIPIISASADIAYVVRDSTNPDSVIISAIQNSGYSYSIIDDSAISSTNLLNYGMILIGDESFSSYINILPINTRPSLVINQRYNDGWSALVGTTSSTQTIQVRNLALTSALTTGLDQYFNIYNVGSNVPVHYLYGKSSSVTSIISIKDDQTKVIVGTKENPKRVWFGITETVYWSDNTKKLFENSINWVIGNEDMDGDGSPAKADCNDHNNTIYPGAQEIPYDGVDQNCDGSDWVDVDGDGYDVYNPEDLLDTDGFLTDCNDNNPNVNPGESHPARNCVNEAPELTEEIPDVEWDEDKYLTLDLDNYFEDPDGEDLIYDISQTSDDQNISITCQIQGCPNGVIILSSQQDWSGKDWVIFSAEDIGGLSVESNNVTLTVLPINDAPVIHNSDSISGIEGNDLIITINATDPEGDDIAYYVESDLTFVQEGNVFTWHPGVGDSGNYIAYFEVVDSQGESEVMAIEITILKKIYINEFVSNVLSGKEWVEVYNPGNAGFDLSSCIITIDDVKNYSLSGEIGSNEFYVYEFSQNVLGNAQGNIKLKCENNVIDEVSYGDTDGAPVPGAGESSGRNPDGEDTGDLSQDFEVFEFPTKGLPSSSDLTPPEVELISPADRAVIIDSRDVTLNFKGTDNEADAMDCAIYIDGNKIKTLGAQEGIVTSYLLEGLDNGEFDWKVECNDGYNKGMSEEWSFGVDAPAGPTISDVFAKNVNEGELVSFTISATNEDGGNLTFTITDKPTGAQFTDNNDGTASFSWQTDFNDAGIYNPKITVENEAGLKSSKIVSIVVKDVEQPLEFSDAPQCDVQSDKIELTIREPSDGEDYNIGDTISVEAKVKNNFDDRLDFDTEVNLYDLDRDRSIEEDSDTMDIRDADYETFEFELEIPDDVKDNNHVVYIYVESEDGDCISDYVNVNIEREKDKIIVKDISVNPKIVYPGENVYVEVEAENVGSRDQDVTISLDISELGISIDSSEFTLEKFGDDDTQSESFNFIVPTSAEQKEYELRATVHYSGDEDSKTETFSVIKQGLGATSNSNLAGFENLGSTFNPSSNDINPEAPDKTTTKTTQNKKTSSSGNGLGWVWIIDIVIVLGIIMEIVIVKVFMNRE